MISQIFMIKEIKSSYLLLYISKDKRDFGDRLNEREYGRILRESGTYMRSQGPTTYTNTGSILPNA